MSKERESIENKAKQSRQIIIDARNSYTPGKNRGMVTILLLSF